MGAFDSPYKNLRMMRAPAKPRKPLSFSELEARVKSLASRAQSAQHPAYKSAYEMMAERARTDLNARIKAQRDKIIKEAGDFGMPELRRGRYG